jgi:ferredoxin-NADP reductase
MKKTLEWQIGTITRITQETPRVKSFTLALPMWMPHRAGQHYDVRLTAPDGYQVQRSYSIASEPERGGEIDLTVEKIDDGEVSPYLHDIVTVGDQVELRGPIGGYFVWEASNAIPLLLIGGGSGVVPLMSMLRHRAAARSNGSRPALPPARLLYSSRTIDDIIYRDELDQLTRTSDGLEIFHTLTRAQPPGWRGFARRIDAAILQDVAGPLGPGVQVFICGPTALVENAANTLVQIGIPPASIKTERFGPSGT